MVTKASEWKQEYEAGIEVELPSGKVVKLKPVGIGTFLKYGGIPDHLTSQVEALLKSQLGQDSGAELIQNLDDFTNQSELIDLFCVTCIVEPKFTLTPHGQEGPDEISIQLMDDDDKVKVFNILGRSTRDIRNFFRQQKENMESVSDSKATSRKAKRSNTTS